MSLTTPIIYQQAWLKFTLQFFSLQHESKDSSATQSTEAGNTGPISEADNTGPISETEHGASTQETEPTSSTSVIENKNI